MTDIIPQARFKLVRDGKTILSRATEVECIAYIHKTHSFSFAHAIEHEGYAVETTTPYIAADTDHKQLIGRRIEIPVHLNTWAQGAKFGVITSFRHGKPGQSDYLNVRMDNKNVGKLVKLFRGDWEYAKLID